MKIFIAIFEDEETGQFEHKLEAIDLQDAKDFANQFASSYHLTLINVKEFHSSTHSKDNF